MADSPDPEVAERPRRRRFSAEYKQAILAEYDRCSADGAKGALLRREGLYSSHIVPWRRARGEGGREAPGRLALGQSAYVIDLPTFQFHADRICVQSCPS